MKIQAGWMLIAAVLKLGLVLALMISAHINEYFLTFLIYCNSGRTAAQGCLQRLFLLWKSTFPRSVKEAEAEKGRGDAFTWGCTLDARAGALASMAVLAEHSSSLMSDDIIRKIVHSVECSLVTVSQ